MASSIDGSRDGSRDGSAAHPAALSEASEFERPADVCEPFETSVQWMCTVLVPLSVAVAVCTRIGGGALTVMSAHRMCASRSSKKKSGGGAVDGAVDGAAAPSAAGAAAMKQRGVARSGQEARGLNRFRGRKMMHRPHAAFVHTHAIARAHQAVGAGLWRRTTDRLICKYCTVLVLYLYIKMNGGRRPTRDEGRQTKTNRGAGSTLT